MKVEILGVGCLKCKQLTANAEAAVKELNIVFRIVRTSLTNFFCMLQFIISKYWEIQKQS